MCDAVNQKVWKYEESPMITHDSERKQIFICNAE